MTGIVVQGHILFLLTHIELQYLIKQLFVMFEF